MSPFLADLQRQLVNRSPRIAFRWYTSYPGTCFPRLPLHVNTPPAEEDKGRLMKRSRLGMLMDTAAEADMLAPRAATAAPGPAPVPVSAIRLHRQSGSQVAGDSVRPDLVTSLDPPGTSCHPSV